MLHIDPSQLANKTRLCLLNRKNGRPVRGVPVELMIEVNRVFSIYEILTFEHQQTLISHQKLHFELEFTKPSQGDTHVRYETDAEKF